jgi:aryl carrier-like protein
VLYARRRQRIEQLRSIYTRLQTGETVTVDEPMELANDLLGRVLDSPWRIAHEALVQVYRWRGSDDPDALARRLTLEEWTDLLVEQAYIKAVLAIAAAARLAHAPDQIRTTGLAALLSETGLMMLPRNLWQVRADLDDVGLNRRQRHVADGIVLASQIAGIPETALRAMYQCAEREDGSGYPERIRGRRIQASAKIVAAADVYASALMPRDGEPPALPYDAAVAVLEGVQHERLDRTAARGLLEVTGLYPAGSLVKLSVGGAAVVIANTPHAMDRPIVRRLTASGGALEAPIDLTRESRQALRVRGPVPRWSVRSIPEPTPIETEPTPALAASA